MLAAMSIGGCNYKLQIVPKNAKYPELEERIGHAYMYAYEDEYGGFLEHPDALDLAEVLGGRFLVFNLDEYNELLEGAEPGSIKRMKDLKDIMGSRFSRFELQNYCRLIEAGVPLETIASYPSTTLGLMANDFEKVEMPPSLRAHMTAEIQQYSVDAARINPVFGTDRKKLQEHLKERLLSKKHLYRKDAQYIELAQQVDFVWSVNMLYLIKHYMDYFDDCEHVNAMVDLANQDLADLYTEYGGLVLKDDDGLRFMRIDTEKKTPKNLENNTTYRQPLWFRHVGNVGLFHLHATEEESKHYAGPSGDPAEKNNMLNVYLGSLRAAGERNPYTMHCVITRIDERRINADIYFHQLSGGRRIGDPPSVIVLDLGIYTATKTPTTQPASNRASHE
jgi:hypothetical protein